MTTSESYTPPRLGLYIVWRVSLGYEFLNPDRVPCQEAARVLVKTGDTPEGVAAVATRWGVDLPDLQALHDFVDKYQRCIIERDPVGYMELAIYDDYVE